MVLEDTLIGGINLTINKWQQATELGYAIARKQYGNGFANEVDRAVIEFGCETYGLARIFAKRNVKNERSWRVMEWIGMTREGIMRN